MKKIYILFTALLISGGLIAQIGPSWWQTLPDDFKTNPHARDTVTIVKVADDVIVYYESLADLWEAVPSEKVDVSSVSNGACNIADAADFSAQGMAFFDNTYFYVMYNVDDEEVNVEGNDRIEMHLAPYGGPYDPGRNLILDRSSYLFKDSLDGFMNFGGRLISQADYGDMAKYGSWTEAGAYKTEWTLITGPDLYPGSPIYSLKEGPEGDTIGDVSMGAIDVACGSVYSPKSGGYYFLAIIPLAVWEEAPDADNFPSMSIAFKVNDADDNNVDCSDPPDETVDRSEMWGPPSVTNDAYWAVAFYGGYGEFDFTVFDPVGIRTIQAQTKSSVYCHDGMLKVNRNEVVSNIRIYSVTGALMKSIDNPSEMVNLYSLQRGVYIVRVTEVSGASNIVKILR